MDGQTSAKLFMSSANGHSTMPRRIASFRPYSGDTSSSSSSASSTTRGRRRFRRRPRPTEPRPFHVSPSARFPRCESAPNMSSGDWLSAGISEVAIVVKASVSKSFTGADEPKIRRKADGNGAHHEDWKHDDSSISSMSSFGDHSCIDRPILEAALPQTFECLDVHSERLSPVKGVEDDSCARCR